MQSAFTANTGRVFGQPRFILHDGIANGVFNEDYISVGSGDPWCSYLQNSPELLDLLLGRMKRDFESTGVKMRKPYGMKELDTCPRKRPVNCWLIMLVDFNQACWTP